MKLTFKKVNMKFKINKFFRKQKEIIIGLNLEAKNMFDFH
jgi:hypothetical protein